MYISESCAYTFGHPVTGGVYDYIPKNASHTGKEKHTYGYFIDVKAARHTKHENESTFFFHS